jgi:50S ribosomal protein L16 3-hydroxylase
MPQAPATFHDLSAASIIPYMAQGLLGTLDAASFLRRHWQKRPLFVRGAAPDCGTWLERGVLFDWAARDDVEARLVMCNRGRWSVQHGPFRPAQLKRLPQRGWTLLVQGVEQLHAAGAALLQQFAFIPHARLDDLMVSYAPPGGGVGPHFDSYDVFLLQGANGTTRWLKTHRCASSSAFVTPRRGSPIAVTCSTCRRVMHTTAWRWTRA